MARRGFIFSILFFPFWLYVFAHCDRLKQQSCVYVGKTKEHFCPEGLSGRENIDRQQLHFSSVIAFHTCVKQTAVAKHNKCKPIAILTVALLSCAGPSSQVIVLTRYYVSPRCILQTVMKSWSEVRRTGRLKTQRGLEISFLIETVTKQHESVWVLCIVTLSQYAVVFRVPAAPLMIG